MWTCLGQITPSEFDDICPLAIPNQISTMSMHIPSLVKIHWCSLKLSSGNEIQTDRRTYDWRTDTGVQRETIISRHYRVAWYKNYLNVYWVGIINLIPYKIINCWYNLFDLTSSLVNVNNGCCLNWRHIRRVKIYIQKMQNSFWKTREWFTSQNAAVIALCWSVFLCLYWGLTAQSTQLDHVERGQFT